MQSGANRPRTLAGRSTAELEGAFARGVPPDPALDGRYDGALLHLTLGPGADVVLESLLRPVAALARQALRRGLGQRRERVRHERLPGRRAADAGRLPGLVARGRLELPRAAVHDRRSRPGRLDPGVEVLRIDYDLPENPPLLRRIVDELVAVQPGVYLGQAILRRGAGGRRLAWFTLE